MLSENCLIQACRFALEKTQANLKLKLKAMKHCGLIGFKATGYVDCHIPLVERKKVGGTASNSFWPWAVCMWKNVVGNVIKMHSGTQYIWRRIPILPNSNRK